MFSSAMHFRFEQYLTRKKENKNGTKNENIQQETKKQKKSEEKWEIIRIEGQKS